MRNATVKTIHSDITTDPIKQMMSVSHVYLFGEKQNTSICGVPTLSRALYWTPGMWQDRAYSLLRESDNNQTNR